MKAQLRNARRASWANTGVARVGKHTAELGSINERRIFQAIRLAVGIGEVIPKPDPIQWFDGQGRERRYSADARVKSEDSIYLEFKPKGLPRVGSSKWAIYEDIGRFLREGCKHRFGLVQWDKHSPFARNTAVLTRYWGVEPGDAARKAFNEIGCVTATLGELLDHVGSTQRAALWAGLAHQHLCADLHGELLTRNSLVSRPHEVFKPILIDDFVSTWWA